MYRILIADDEPDILEGLEYVINWDEHGIEIAGRVQNGVEALQMISSGNIDLLLTDIRMPKMDGLTLIRQLKLDGSVIRCIILSGYDDFKYIKEAIRLGIENYLLKPVDKDELSTTLLNTIDKIESERNRNISGQQGLNIFKENILYRWLSASLGDDELREKALLAGIDLKFEFYTVAIVRLLNRKGIKQDSSRNQLDASMISAKVICSSTLCCEESQIYVFVSVNGDMVLIFPEHSPTDRAGIKARLERCISIINQTLKLDVFVSIGSTGNSFQQAHVSYESANELQSYSLIQPRNSLIDHDEVIQAVYERQRKLVIDFQSFNRMLIAKQEDDCIRFIDDVFNRLGTIRGLTPKSVQNIAIEILYHLNNTITNSTKGTHMSDDDDISFTDVYSIHTLEELKGWLKLVAGNAIGQLKAGSNNHSPHIQMVLAYIYKNYNKEITIKQLSTQFNISTAYLGQLFKNETGEMFTNYINSIRIEKAKELLSTTNMKASEISELVGYPNTNYFYRIFKKLTGISPTEFR